MRNQIVDILTDAGKIIAARIHTKKEIDSKSTDVDLVTGPKCISESSASCIRAPPDAEKHRKGQRSVRARSTPRTNFSPTTDPIEPPM